MPLRGRNLTRRHWMVLAVLVARLGLPHRVNMLRIALLMGRGAAAATGQLCAAKAKKWDFLASYNSILQITLRATGKLSGQATHHCLLLSHSPLPVNSAGFLGVVQETNSVLLTRMIYQLHDV